MECPHCQNKIEVPDLWEFFDCTNCGASLQLENNELKILKEPDENTSSHPEQELQQQENLPVEDSISEKTPEHSVEPVADSLPNNQKESTPGNLSEAPISQSLEEEIQNNNEQAKPVQNAAQSPAPEENENLSNILDFGSSPNQKNHFNYHLHIEGISSKALFDKIRHVLKSPRVKLDCPNQAANNTLIINNLNAVQMVYLVRKLSPLSVQIHWTQKSTLVE